MTYSHISEVPLLSLVELLGTLGCWEGDLLPPPRAMDSSSSLARVFLGMPVINSSVSVQLPGTVRRFEVGVDELLPFSAFFSLWRTREKISEKITAHSIKWPGEKWLIWALRGSNKVWNSAYTTSENCSMIWANALLGGKFLPAFNCASLEDFWTF